MSTVSKVFIVVNLFLTFVYVFLAAALLAQKNDYHEKYLEKQKYNDGIIQLQDEQITEHKKSIVKVQEEISANVDSIQQQKLISEAYASRIRLLKDRKAEKEEKLPNVEASKNKLEEEIENKERDNNALKEQKERLTDNFNEIQTAQEEAVAAKDEVAEGLKNAYNQITELAEQLSESKKSVSKQNAMTAGNITIDELAPVSGKKIDGKIIAISPGANQVMLNVGASKKVEVGDRFVVSRGDSYVSQIEVDQVFPEMSAARIIVGTKAQGAQIQEGDNASTRLK